MHLQIYPLSLTVLSHTYTYTHVYSHGHLVTHTPAHTLAHTAPLPGSLSQL